MRIYFIIMQLVSVMILSGCATKAATPVQVKTGERTTLAFTGKGAAAGVMMDAFLGGAGVAIGIAIDEGIAKDITENILKPPATFNVVSVVEKNILALKSERKSFQILKGSDAPPKNSVSVVVDTYGFRSFPGEGDKVTAWIKLRFIEKTKESIVNYPADFESPKAIDLSEVKTNSKVATVALEDAITLSINKWFAANGT